MIRILILILLCGCASAKHKFTHKHMALADNLEAYWGMEQNPILFPVHDQSGNGHHLTGFGDLAHVAGKVGMGIEMSADDEYLDLLISTYPGIDLNGKEFTAIIWFKPSELSNNMGIFGSGFAHWFARIVLSGSNFYVNVKIDGGSLTITDVPLEVDQWYFLALGWHGNSSNFGQYSWGSVNLSERVREAKAPFVDSDQTFAITGSSSTNAFRGTADECAIFTRRLSDDELRMLYNDGAGLPFEEWETTPCKSITCCD